MADDELRVAEREWRANEQDQPALARWIEARYRAGLPVTHDLLERQVHPPRRFDLPVPAQVWVDSEPPLTARTPVGGDGLLLPQHRRLRVTPEKVDVRSLAAVRDAGDAIHELVLHLDEPERLAEALRALAGASVTHLNLWGGSESLDPAAFELVEILPRLASLRCSLNDDRELSAGDLACFQGSACLSSIHLVALIAPGALGELGSVTLQELRVVESTRRECSLDETDSELATLASRAPGLRELDLWISSRRPTDEGLLALGKGARGLERLRLHRGRIWGSGVRGLAGLPLRDLALRVEEARSDAMGVLADLPLEVLHLTGAHHEGLQLSQLPRGLRELEIAVFCASLEPLSWLPRLIHLEELTLNLDQTPPLGALASVSGLRKLGLEYPPYDGVASDSLSALRGCAALRELSLWYLRDFLPTSVEALLEIPLESLDLHFVGMTDSDAQILATHPTLCELGVDWCRELTEAGLAALARAPRLRRLEIGFSERVTPEGLRAIAATRPDLEVTHDYERVVP